MVEHKSLPKIHSIGSFKIKTTYAGKLLGLEFNLFPPHHFSSEYLIERISKASNKLLNNNPKIICLPLNIINLINSSKIEAIPFTYGDFIFGRILESNRFRDDLEYACSHIIRKSCYYSWKINLLSASALLGRLPIWARIMKTNLHRIYHELFNNINVNEHLTFFLMYPNLAPTISSKEKWWGKNKLIDHIVLKFINAHWLNQHNNNYQILGEWKPLNTRTKIDKHTTLLLGRFNFLTNNQPCLCGSPLNEPVHWLTQCPKTESERKETLIRLKTTNKKLIPDFIRTKYTNLYYEYFELIFTTHIQPIIDKHKESGTSDDL